MATLNPQSIYRKTAKGVEEFERRTYKLSSKARMVLILVNNRRRAAEIIADIPDGTEEILGQLLDGGFIEASAPAAAIPPSAPPARAQVAAAPPPAAPAKFDFKSAQHAAVKAVEEMLGPEGEPIELKIERAKTEAELLAVIEKTRDMIQGLRGPASAAKFWKRVFPD